MKKIETKPQIAGKLIGLSVGVLLLMFFFILMLANNECSDNIKEIAPEAYLIILNDDNIRWKDADDFLCTKGVVVSDWRGNEYGIGDNSIYLSTFHKDEKHTTDHGVCFIIGGRKMFYYE